VIPFFSSLLVVAEGKQGAIAKTQTGFAPGSKYKRNYLIQEYEKDSAMFPVPWLKKLQALCLFGDPFPAASLPGSGNSV